MTSVNTIDILRVLPEAVLSGFAVLVMVLDPFLVPAQLLFDLVFALVHRRFRGRPLLAGDKVVLVLRRDEDLHLPGMLEMFDLHLDRRNTIIRNDALDQR